MPPAHPSGKGNPNSGGPRNPVTRNRPRRRPRPRAAPLRAGWPRSRGRSGLGRGQECRRRADHRGRPKAPHRPSQRRHRNRHDSRPVRRRPHGSPSSGAPSAVNAPVSARPDEEPGPVGLYGVSAHRLLVYLSVCRPRGLRAHLHAACSHARRRDRQARMCAIHLRRRPPRPANPPPQPHKPASGQWRDLGGPRGLVLACGSRVSGYSDGPGSVFCKTSGSNQGGACGAAARPQRPRAQLCEARPAHAGPHRRAVRSARLTRTPTGSVLLAALSGPGPARGSLRPGRCMPHRCSTQARVRTRDVTGATRPRDPRS